MAIHGDPDGEANLAEIEVIAGMSPNGAFSPYATFSGSFYDFGGGGGQTAQELANSGAFLAAELDRRAGNDPQSIIEYQKFISYYDQYTHRNGIKDINLIPNSAIKVYDQAIASFDKYYYGLGGTPYSTVRALLHAFIGDGRNLFVNINDIHMNVEAKDVPALKNMISTFTQPGTYNFRDTNFGYSTYKDSYFVSRYLGSIVISAEGSFTLHADGKYEYSMNVYSAKPDLYDFDAKINQRAGTAEFETTIGRNLVKAFGGTSYYIEIQGSKNFSGTGNIDPNSRKANDYLIGDDYNDIITYNAQYSSLSGGNGDDTYLYNDSTASVHENYNAGHDRVISSIDITAPSNVEEVILVGHAIRANGNSQSNNLYGNQENNYFSDLGNKDFVDGDAGFDIVNLTGNYSDYSIVKSGREAVLRNNYETIRLINVEELHFSNGHVKFESLPEVKEYIASYADLITQYGLDTRSAIDHFVQDIRPVRFSSISYLAANSDLIPYFGTDKIRAAEHYISYGRNEGRSTEFDHLAYLASNPGFAQALGGTNAAVSTEHYVRWTAASGIAVNAFNYYRYVSLQDGVDTLTGVWDADTLSFAKSTVGNVVVDFYNYATWDSARGGKFATSIKNAIGSRFNDSLEGNGSDNILDGGPGGADTIRGNGGSDTVSYATSARSVIVAMYHHTTWDGENNDSLDSIENAIGSRFNDTLDGDGGDNILDGGAGGADTIRGNGGSDTVSYATSAKSVIVAMGSRITWDGENNDSLDSIENAIGSRFNDTLDGDGGDNILDGGPGGRDTIQGNGGSDTVSYATSARGVIVAMGSRITWDGENNDSLDSIENAIGSRFDDTLDGDGGDNILDGGPGGRDTIQGNGGSDTVSYATSTRGVTVAMYHHTTWDGENNDSLSSIENAIGSRFDDTLDGDGGNNILNGGGGNDTLYGRGGSDRFVFSWNSGRDTIQDFHAEEGDRLDLQGQNYWVGQNDRGFAVLNLSGGGAVELTDVPSWAMSGYMFA